MFNMSNINCINGKCICIDVSEANLSTRHSNYKIKSSIYRNSSNAKNIYLAGHNTRKSIWLNISGLRDEPEFYLLTKFGHKMIAAQQTNEMQTAKKYVI